jgi:hypothetical protein
MVLGIDIGATKTCAASHAMEIWVQNDRHFYNSSRMCTLFLATIFQCIKIIVAIPFTSLL